MLDDFNFMPIGVIAYGVALAIVVECLQYLIVYRTTGFRSLKQNLDKHAAKLESARGGNGGASGTSSSKGVRKREARLQDWEEVAGKQMAALHFKTGIVTMASMMLSLRLVPMIFGNQPVARLPFQPPAFLQKATHRGLTGSDPQDCSALFLFMLCQGSVKPLVGKIIGWGPTRRMLEGKLQVPKASKQS